MIGEGNVVQIVIGVVGIEGAPAAVFALQALHPFATARDGVPVIRFRRNALFGAVQRHHHHGGVVEIGIIGVVVLKGPAAGTHAGLFLRPIAFHIQNLERLQPFKPARHSGIGLDRARFHQRMADQRRIPHRRDARLAIGFVVLSRPTAFRPICGQWRGRDASGG